MSIEPSPSLRVDKLPPATAQLLEIMAASCEELRRFVLIGGTALTLHIGHRISEDLDFSFPGRHLPKRDIDRMLDTMEAMGMSCLDTISDVQKEEAFNDGDDLDEIQRNFLVTGGPLGDETVKLTFVIHGDRVKDTDYLAHVLPECLPYGHTQIATVPVIFTSKCVALSDRIKSRDLLDLWWLTHRYAPAWHIADIFHTVQQFRPQTYEDTRARLLDYRIPETDEGFAMLVAEPITVETIRADFRREVEAHELEQIAQIQQTIRQDDGPAP